MIFVIEVGVTPTHPPGEPAATNVTVWVDETGDDPRDEAEAHVLAAQTAGATRGDVILTARTLAVEF